MGVRCFLGLALPDTYQEGLEDIITAWRPRLRSKISWTRKGNWHLTLSFLGEVSEELLDRVQKRLETVTRPSFELQAGGAGFFPPGKTPRVVWIGLSSGALACKELAEDIEQALEPLGFPLSKKEFRAHLTLARIKKAGQDDWKALLLDLNKRQWPAFCVRTFVLWQSQLTPRGPVYTRLKDYPLA